MFTKNIHMRTNVVIDDNLMKEAMLLGEFKTQRETNEKSLEFFIRLKNQAKIRNYRGILRWEGNLEQSRIDR